VDRGQGKQCFPAPLALTRKSASLTSPNLRFKHSSEKVDWNIVSLHPSPATSDAPISLAYHVICDTQVAHLGGGLGRLVQVLFERAPDWRGPLDHFDSPWR
jgi:hypothetical protein